MLQEVRSQVDATAHQTSTALPKSQVPVVVLGPD